MRGDRMLPSVRPVVTAWMLLASMGVRGPDPNQTDMLDARTNVLVFRVPSNRLLRHTLLRVARRPPTTSGGV